MKPPETDSRGDAVLLFIEDWKTRVYIRALLRERGIEAIGVDRLKDALVWLASPSPYEGIALLVLDATSTSLPSREVNLLISGAADIPCLLLLSRMLEADLPAPVRILYKPFSPGEVVEKVEAILKERHPDTI